MPAETKVVVTTIQQSPNAKTRRTVVVKPAEEIVEKHPVLNEAGEQVLDDDRNGVFADVVVGHTEEETAEQLVEPRFPHLTVVTFAPVVEPGADDFCNADLSLSIADPDSVEFEVGKTYRLSFVELS